MSSPQAYPIYSTPSPVPTAVQGGSASRFPRGWDPATRLSMLPEFFTTSSAAQFNASATQPMTPQQNASTVQPTTQSAWNPQMAAQFNATAPPLMTPQQHLVLLLQPKTPSEILVSRSPQQGGVNWIFQDQMTGALRRLNVPYMDSSAQQSASPSAPQLMATSALTMYQQPTNQMAQQLPNQMAQQAQQMASANRPMTPTSPQPVAAVSPTNLVSPQQMPAVG